MVHDVNIDEKPLGQATLQPVGLEPSWTGYDLSVKIDRTQQGTYIADAMGPSGYCRVPIGLTPDDLADLNLLLQEGASSVTRKLQSSPSVVEKRNIIRDLSDIGRYVFNRVFCNGNQSTSPLIRAIGVAEKYALKSGHQVSIQFVSDDFFLPWELLCSDKMSNDEEMNFWGERYVISCFHARLSFHISPVIIFEDCPKLGLLTYDRLDAVRNKETPFFTSLSTAGQVLLKKLRPLNACKKQEELLALQNFCSQDFNLVHFACHATFSDRVPDRSFLTISNEFDVSIIDLGLTPIAVRGRPLVILNACSSGKSSPLKTTDFVVAFLQQGARGVIATDCEISDDFAAQFTEALYRHLLNGETLGESLLQSRRYFLKNDHNPAGLFYSMHASASTRLQRA
jgi:hypothetical protein